MYIRLSFAWIAVALAALVQPTAAKAADVQMWVRASWATAAQQVVDLWNTGHDEKIGLTVIPDNQMVSKLAAGTQAGTVPDLVAFDLIYMPDFMKAGLFKDITGEMRGDPNYAGIAQPYQNIATYQGKIYGVGFTPAYSVLVWNKDLFRAAGLDPEKAPATIEEIHQDAKKIAALGNGNYGYYFSGSCPGCNIFVISPMMVAAGAKLLPTTGTDDALSGDGVKDVLSEIKAMWDEKLIPESAQADSGGNFTVTFESGKIGMQGAGDFIIAQLKKDVPKLNFGVGLLPGTKPGEVSSFVGGDIMAIPALSKHQDIAVNFIHWMLTDQGQLEGLAKYGIMPARPALADNQYSRAEPKLAVAGEALAKGSVPWAFHFNDMVNADSSPWIQMLQTAIFDGDVDGAIKTAQDAMKAIAAQ